MRENSDSELELSEADLKGVDGYFRKNVETIKRVDDSEDSESSDSEDSMREFASKRATKKRRQKPNKVNKTKKERPTLLYSDQPPQIEEVQDGEDSPTKTQAG